MAQHQQNEQKQTNPDASAPEQCDVACEARRESGPVREGGGTTGAANLAAGQANRTGGATSGVGTDAQRPAKAGRVPPSA